jgi:hypothetical protein
MFRILEQVRRQRQQGIEKLEEMEKDGTLDRLIASAMDRSQDSSPPAPERSE